MGIERNNILFLLGAGASRDAGIPVSVQMVNMVNDLVKEDKSWQPYRDLYHYLRSSIQYADGIMGDIYPTFNIEKLIIVMSEIEKKERNPIYPFIGAWNNRLLDLAGTRFENITALRELITKELVSNWVNPSIYRNAKYYDGFKNLVFGGAGLGFNVKVFSLNYDLCFEKIVGLENIELGFDEDTSEWSYNNFSRIDADDKAYTLYKLHGSLDWFNDSETHKLMKADGTTREPVLIFGVSNKLRAIDPYLFYIYEFRKYCFLSDLRLIVCIGYSFSDDHINDIIAQALKNNSQARVLATVYGANDEYKSNVRRTLGLGEGSEQVIFQQASGKEFIGEMISVDYIADKFLVENLPFAATV